MRDIRFDLSSPAKDSGQICDTQRVIGIGGQSTLDCYVGKTSEMGFPQKPEIHRAGKGDFSTTQAFYGAGPIKRRQLDNFGRFWASLSPPPSYQ